MSKSLKKLIDINRLREFKNKLVGAGSPYVQTGAVDQTIAGTKTFSKPIVGSVTGSSGSCTGNAATATQFSANATVALTGDATGTSAGSKKGWSVPVTLANSGVTAGTYGPSADVTGNNNATISVPEITVDAKGRVTSVVNRTLTCKNNTYTVNNATLTIQKNGTTVKTFTANASANVTANITVPTKVSELTNDSGFLTSHQSLSNYVTLNGAQTISGAKTFTGDIIGIIKNDSTEDANSLYSTTAGSKLTYYTTSNGSTRLTNVPDAINTTLESRTIRRLSDSDWVVEQICHNTNGLYYRKGVNGTWGAWKTFAFTDSNISGNAATATTATTAKACTGNAASANIATKATQDAAGNTITTTYATKAENNTKANNSEVVHKSGDETIVGTKTFSNGVLSTAVNAFMAQNKGYTVLLRNDGSTTYLLISDKDGVPGTWSSARPFVISNSTGVCDINGNAATATTATTAKACTGNAATATTATTAKACTGNAATATKLATARSLWGNNFDGSAAISGTITGTPSIEFKPTATTSNNGGVLDFHYNQSTADYTSRIIESASGTLSINNVTITTGKVVTATTFNGALTGNVTGNCSGSSGSCTGNAATATKLAAKRTIALSGAATGTATGFDGSGNITIPVTALASSAIRAQWYAAYPDGAEAHNAMWGGRDITAAFNAGTVSANIANGTFRDIFPGDYITKQVTISGTAYTVNWVIADCDYWIYKGDADMAMKAHHVAIVPQVPIFTARMNATNTTEGGYAGSEMYRNVIPACATGIVSAFGSSHILTFSDNISNSVDTSAVSSGITVLTGAPNWMGDWVSVQCNLMSEKMVYGAPICSAGAMDNTMATRQMSAFRLSERLINCNRKSWWLRDVVSSTFFADVIFAGTVHMDYASDVLGVRPFALLV